MHLPMVQQGSRLLASGLSVCLLAAVGAGCSANNGSSSPTATKSRSSCVLFPPVPQGPAVVTAGGFAYGVNTVLDKVVWYKVESTGVLNRLGDIDTEFQPTFITAHRTRNLVYVANFCSNTVSAYTIGTNGALTLLGSVSAGDQPASIAVNSKDDFVYVTNFGADSVSAYKIEANGALTLRQTLTTGGGPDAVEIYTGPTDTFAYVANFKSNTVSAYKVVAAGAGAGTLEATVPNAPFSADLGPNAIALHPTGSVLYVTNETSDTARAYSVNSTTGELTPAPLLPSPSVPTRSGPEGVTIDPSGNYMFVANGQGDSVSTYTLDPTTGLLLTTGPEFAVVDDPEGIAVDPTGKYVYTVNRNTKDISIFQIQPGGSLTALLPNVPL